MPAAILGPIAGSVVGGLMSDSGGGEQQTASKEPWEPARKPLINTLDKGQGLERYYQQNPFNALQQTGYQNLFGDLDAFRNQMAPGLMQFANGAMTSNYQRGPRNSQMEAMQAQQRPMLMQGQDGVYQAAPTGLLQSQPQSVGGLLGGQGPFMVPQGQSYGPLDFRELNPFTATNGIPPAPAPAAPAPAVNPEDKPYDWRDDYERILRGGMNYTGAGA